MQTTRKENTPDVIGEMLFSGEGLRAVGTAVRRLPSVLTYVVRKVLFASERLRTISALVWRLPRVLPHMIHYCKTIKSHKNIQLHADVDSCV